MVARYSPARSTPINNRMRHEYADGPLVQPGQKYWIEPATGELLVWPLGEGPSETDFTGKIDAMTVGPEAVRIGAADLHV